jgi:hypothetical protein
MTLLQLVPWPYRIAAIAAVFLASMAFGFVKGVTFESGRRDVLDAKREASGRIIVKRIEHETVRIQKVYVARAAKREAAARTADTEVAAHAVLPDPAAGYLEPERVRNINRAWGVAGYSAGPDAAVPDDSPAPVGIPPGDGTVGGESGR